MTTLLLVGYLLFAHWICDFVLQTDEQAKNKSSSNKFLLQHCFSYSFWMWIWTLPLFALGILPLGEGFLLLLLFFATHLPTDYVTSRINTKLYGEGRTHDFFVSIGFDQFLHHAVILFAVYLIVS